MMRERSMRRNGTKGRVPVFPNGNTWWGLIHCGSQQDVIPGSSACLMNSIRFSPKDWTILVPISANRKALQHCIWTCSLRPLRDNEGIEIRGWKAKALEHARPLDFSPHVNISTQMNAFQCEAISESSPSSLGRQACDSCHHLQSWRCTSVDSST